MSEVAVLRAALMWLRNHYDNNDRSHADDVLTRIDAVLDNNNPTMADMKLFRDMYPAQLVEFDIKATPRPT